MFRNKLVLLLSLCLIYISGFSQEKYYVSTIVGDTSGMYKGIDSNSGYRDGVGVFARLNGPTGLALDTFGALYVTDTYNNLIRRINTVNNSIETIAGDTADIKKGLDSNIGYLNGPAFTAKFSNPLGLCVDKFGNVYIADTYNNVIRKLSTSGMVTTYAGKDSAGITFAGYVNGADSVAEFFAPTSLTIDTAGNIFVADDGNNAIREISAAGMVTTLAGKGFSTAGYINGPVDTAEFATLFGIALGNAGTVYVTQFGNGANAVRRVYHDTVTTYAGYDTADFDIDVTGTIPSGYQNGKDTNSRGDTSIVGVLFNSPTGIAFDTANNLLIADEYNNVIRLFNAKDSIVTTFAGNHFNDSIHYSNDWDSLAVFLNPVGIAADKKGNIYVSDLGNNVIRKIILQPVSGITTVKQPVYTLKAYPNPCSGKLNIVSSFNGKADLLDVTGRVIWTNDNFKSPYTLNTSTVSPGVYFLRISSPAATEIKKIEVVK